MIQDQRSGRFASSQTLIKYREQKARLMREQKRSMQHEELQASMYPNPTIGISTELQSDHHMSNRSLQDKPKNEAVSNAFFTRDNSTDLGILTKQEGSIFMRSKLQVKGQKCIKHYLDDKFIQLESPNKQASEHASKQAEPANDRYIPLKRWRGVKFHSIDDTCKKNSEKGISQAQTNVSERGRKERAHVRSMTIQDTQ